MARARVVVLVSGGGTNLQALIDAAGVADYPANIVAVGADRPDIPALERAAAAEIPTFVAAPDQYLDRESWDAALAEATAVYDGPVELAQPGAVYEL